MGSPSSRPLKVFVSHSSADRALVESGLLPALRSAKLDYWFSADSIDKGAEWEMEIVEALASCDALLVVMTPNAQGSRWIRYEVNWAMSNLPPDRVIPLLVAPCVVDRIHPLLTQRQHVDARDDLAEGGARAAAALAKLGRREGPEAARDPIEAALLAVGAAPDAPTPEQRATLQTVPFERLRDTIQAIVARGKPEETDLLGGALSVIGASAAYVALLDRLAEESRGPFRARVITVLERKRAGLAEDEIRRRLATIDPRLEIVDGLGQGLLTTAFLARERATGKTCVVRLLRSEWAASPLLRDRYLRLAERYRDARSRSLVGIHWIGSDRASGLVYLVREYVEGASLRQLVESGHSFGRGETASILRQLVRALASSDLHALVPLHGGIRPSNLYLTPGERVVLGDPACLLPAEALEIGVPFQGLLQPLRYAAPESLSPGWSPPADAPSPAGLAYDMYAVGAVAHELLTGKPPVHGENVVGVLRESTRPWQAEREGVTGDAARLLSAFLAHDPAERHAGWDAALSAIERFASAAPSAAAPPAPARAAPTGAPVAAPSPAADPGWSQLIADSNRANATLFVRPADLAVGVAHAGGTVPAPAPSSEEDGRGMDLAAEEAEAIPNGSPQPARDLGARTIGGRYTILRTLGVGGMATVYLAADRRLQRQVAIKVLNPALASSDPDYLVRFEAEVRRLVELEHPSVLRVLDVGHDEGVTYLVTDFLSGGSLKDRIERAGPAPVADLALWLPSVARALDFVHRRGFVHRDVKPANILFDAEGNAFLADLGITRAASDDTSITRAGMTPGTPGYMGPEVASGSPLGPAYDQYGLATCAFEALTGRRPFDDADSIRTLMRRTQEVAPSVRQLVPDVSAAAADAIARALERDPDKRFASCVDFASALVHEAPELIPGIVQPPTSSGRREFPAPEENPLVRWLRRRFRRR